MSYVERKSNDGTKFITVGLDSHDLTSRRHSSGRHSDTKSSRRSEEGLRRGDSIRSDEMRRSDSIRGDEIRRSDSGRGDEMRRGDSIRSDEMRRSDSIRGDEMRRGDSGRGDEGLRRSDSGRRREERLERRGSRYGDREERDKGSSRDHERRDSRRGDRSSRDYKRTNSETSKKEDEKKRVEETASELDGDKTPVESPRKRGRWENGGQILKNGKEEGEEGEIEAETEITPKGSRRWEDEEEMLESKMEEEEDKNGVTSESSPNDEKKEASHDKKRKLDDAEENGDASKKRRLTSQIRLDLPKEESSIGRLFQEGLHSCRSISNFEKICRIGDGAYGVVYKARDKQTNETVALKKVKMEKEKEGFPLTSIREIRILMSCKHTNIVSVKEIVVGDIDSIFIAMEYLEHDLKTLMEDMQKPFNIAEVKCIINQLLLGVEYLHDNWILHRDIKTSNLLLNNQGIMKIADFGLARPYGSPLRPYTHVVVTLWYRAPELLLGTKTYTPAIDMWSVGCVFAELLNMKPIFKGKGDIDQLDQIFRLVGYVNEEEWPGYQNLPLAKNFKFAKKTPGSLRSIFSSSRLSDAGHDLLQRMLTYNPDHRITAKAALQHPYFEESPLQQDPDLMPTWPSRAEGRKPRNTDKIVESPNMDGEREKERETFMGQRDRNYIGFRMSATGAKLF